ncbi:extensin-like [Lathyrus oleraceus]|uniref:extensin-like n=1 Tax=Pisum sativum TaxID=3888 RepID=UPI0021D37BAB|nr:extensin-like [Pisum sativum]
MKEGVDISDFNLSDLPDKPPNFMKHPRGPSEKARQAKKARLGDSSGSRPPAPLHGPSGKSVSLAPSAQTHPIASSIPQPTPIYTHSETPPSTTKTSHQPSQKFNLATTTLPLSDAEMLNETTSSSSSRITPYFNISSDTEHFDPSSPTLAQLQAQTLVSQQPTQTTPEPEVTSPPAEQPNPTRSDLQPSETNNSDIHPPNTSAEPQTPTLNLSPPNSPPPPSEPENTLPTLEEAKMLFVGASVDKVKSLTISDDPSAVRTH